MCKQAADTNIHKHPLMGTRALVISCLCNVGCWLVSFCHILTKLRVQIIRENVHATYHIGSALFNGLIILFFSYENIG